MSNVHVDRSTESELVLSSSEIFTFAISSSSISSIASSKSNATFHRFA